MNENKSLKKKTITGLFWSFSDLVLNQGIQFIIQVFLARLLLPEEFGLIGMITVFIGVSNSIIDSGFTNALIREENSSQDDYSTVFYFNLIMAAIMYITLYSIAPLISKFYNEPILTSMLRILALTVIINSFGLIQRAILIKRIDFKTQTTINVISSIASGIIAIYCAYNGMGVWSLVIRSLIMQIIQSVLLCITNKWLPSLVFRMTSFKRLFNFGWKLMVSGLVDTVYENTYYLVIGKFFSATQLGYYTNARKLEDIPATSITASVQKVSYPVLSKFKDDDTRLKVVYKKIIKNSVFIIFPVMIGLAAIAKPFITVVFGEKWVESVYYFQLLAFGGMLLPLHAVNLNVLKVKGRSDLFLRLEILKKCISVILIAGVLICKLGIWGLLSAYVLDSYISYFINSYYSGKTINYSTLEQIKDITPIFISTMLMGIITYSIGFILPCGNLMKGIIQIIIGVISYIGISLLLKVEELSDIYQIIIQNFKTFKKEAEV